MCACMLERKRTRVDAHAHVMFVGIASLVDVVGGVEAAVDAGKRSHAAWLALENLS